MTATSIRRGHGERGMVLVLIAFMVILLGGLAVGFLSEGLTARSSVDHHESSLHALEACEIGLVRAEAEIRAQVDHGADGIGNVVGAIGRMKFEVKVFDDPVSADRYILRAEGRHAWGRRRVEVGLRRRVSGRFVEGMFAREDLVLNGNVQTDAYDSSLGDYASQVLSLDAGGAYSLIGGHIGSNAGIRLTGSAVHVRGNAIPGPLRGVDRSGDPTVLGDMMARRDLIDLPPAPFEEFADAFALNNNASLSLIADSKIDYDDLDYTLSLTGGAALSLEPGTYFFTDFTAKGNSTIQLLGPVKIYVTGSLDLSGGIVMNGGAPSDLRIYVHPYDLPLGYNPTSASVKVNGGSEARMALYGPGADLTVGGGDHFYGAAIAKTIKVNGNCFFHYDKALGDLELINVPTLERLYWREISPPRR